MVSARHQSIFLMIIRRLRAPLILLIAIISISVLGLTITPGPMVDGQPQYMSFFQAFYFISYTATTIGFGEIPYLFSDQQRLWVMFCIYMSVIGWAYTLGTVFALLADRSLQQAIAMLRFVRAVRHMSDPFYLVCGYGETGRLVCQALNRRDSRMVVVEINENRVGEIDLSNYTADVPALAADAGNPDTLRYAGLTHLNCVGVIAVTNDDEANLAISIAARLLSPHLPVVARAGTREAAAKMIAFGTAHIINPFEKFTNALSLALHAPAAWQLLNWLTGLPGTPVKNGREPPHGAWILCGYNRPGRLLTKALDANEVEVSIIDRQLTPEADGHLWVQGDAASPAALEAAGVLKAVGLAVCTDSDVNNLSIAVAARELNKNLYVVLRQNYFSNRALFEAFTPDLALVPSEIIAHECLAILSTPLLATFLAGIRERGDEEWCAWLHKRMTQRLGGNAPEIWSVRLNFTNAPALHRRLMRGETITLDQLLRSHANRYEYVACEVLYIARDDDNELIIPAATTPVRPGDELLLAGRMGARSAFELNISNEHALAYIVTGHEPQQNWLLDKLTRKIKIWGRWGKLWVKRGKR
ncbi:MAG: NAD-binding protein [Azoarcus sp.]|jgi:Trk K+ transport system NAD-binding subunit|nr:NAD-binding protein [Azoarcus sp.]